jgi:hypothetical protein
MIAGRLKGQPEAPPFKYFDKGSLATVARNFAVMEAFGIRTGGLFPKMVWAFVHIQFLDLTSSRIETLLHWYWKLLTRQRLARLISESEPMQDAIQPTQYYGRRTIGKAVESRSDRIARLTVKSMTRISTKVCVYRQDLPVEGHDVRPLADDIMEDDHDRSHAFVGHRLR